MRFPTLRLTPAAHLALTQGVIHVALPCRERALQQVGETFSPRLGSLLEVRHVSPPSGIAQGDTVRLAAPGHPRLVAQVTFVQALPQGALPQDVPHAPSSTGLYWVVPLTAVTCREHVPELRRTLGRERRRSGKLQAQVKRALTAQQQHQQRVNTTTALLAALKA